MRKFVALAAIAVGSLGISACGPDAGSAGDAGPSGDGERIVIGSIGTFSGPNAELGIDQRRSLELALEAIAPEGELAGKVVEVVERDDQGSPEKAVAAARELAQDDEVIAVVGPTLSGTTLAAVPVLNGAGVPNTSAAGGTAISSLSEGEENYFFRASLTDDAQAKAAVRGAIEAGYEKIAVASDTSGYGQGGRENILNALKAENLEPTTDVTYTAGSSDLTAQLNQIKDSDAEVVINWGYNAEAVQLLRASEQVGYDGQFIFSWAQGTRNFMDLAGDRIDGQFVTGSFTITGNEDEQASDVFERYDANYGEQPNFANGVAAWYDGTIMLLRAIEESGAEDRQAVMDAVLATSSLDGLIKEYESPFTADNRDAVSADDIGLYRIEGGQIIPLEN